MVTATQPKALSTIQQCLPTFQEVVPAQVIRDLARVACAPHRFYERIFTPVVLVWCLIFQRLNADHSCDAVVSYVRSRAIDHLDDRHCAPLSQRLRSESSSAFCQARARLPLEVLTGVLHQSAHAIQHAAGAGALWLGHHVVLLDGSTITLYPFGDLVEEYGQHANQYGPTYWVEMRVTGAFCLRTGALLDLAEGSLHQSEQVLVRTVLKQLDPGSVCVGDENFGVFSVAQAARQQGLFVLLRLTAARARALVRRPLPATLDVPVAWAPSRQDQCVPDLSTEPIAGRLIAVRLQRDGFRPVDLYWFTTLVDQTCYTVEDLCTLYGFRWHVELDLRYVKATLNMDLLHAKSADTARKELYAGLIAYNLIRAAMSDAAERVGLTPLALSFTQCWRRLRDTLFFLWTADTLEDVRREIERVLSRLGKCRLMERQRFRIEPRAVRKRRLPYPPLKGSRDAARQRLREQLQTSAKS
ncbi:MAG: IS4 family transposase [Chloroflexota bacterium]|nr:MAG: IS4 family transposase [Chloroflexota bacterium]